MQFAFQNEKISQLVLLIRNYIFSTYKTVHIFLKVTAGTIEEKIFQRQLTKQGFNQLFSAIFLKLERFRK